VGVLSIYVAVPVDVFPFKIDAAKGGERQLLCCGPFQFSLLFIVLLLFRQKGAGSTALPVSTRNNVRWFKVVQKIDHRGYSF